MKRSKNIFELEETGDGEVLFNNILINHSEVKKLGLKVGLLSVLNLLEITKLGLKILNLM